MWPSKGKVSPARLLGLVCVVGGLLGALWWWYDRDERRVSELLDVEREFCERAAREGIHEAFVHYMATDGVVFDVDPRKVVGPAALEARRARWSRIKKLDWTPLRAEVARSNDLGFTWGVSRMEIQDVGGAVQVVRGLYVSVWRRDGDGRWKLALDTGNSLTD